MDLEALRGWNPHWYGAPVSPRVLKHPQARSMVRHWAADLLTPPDDMWALKAGPRQVGKTTSLGHVATVLMTEHGVAPRRIVIAVMDDEAVRASMGGRLETLIQMAASLDPPTAREPTFLLIDEMQALDDWAAQLKSAWDRHHGAVRLLATGSSALRLLRPADADFHGRVRTVTVHPMKFREVLEGHPAVRDFMDDETLQQILRAAGNARAALDDGHDPIGNAFDTLHGALQASGAASFVQTLWLEYCAWGGYPAIRPGTQKRPAERLDHLEGALSTVIARDVIQGGLRKIREFRRLLRHIARNPGGKFEPYGIGRDLGGVDGDSIRTWKQILEDVMLVQQLEPLKPNLTPHKGNDKAYVTDPSWISFFRGHAQEVLDADDPLLGLIVETVLADHVRRLRFNLKGTSALPLGYIERPEVDLAMDLGNRWLLLEAKYSGRPRVNLGAIGPHDAVRVVATRDRFEIGPPGGAHLIPAHEFALIC